MRLWLGIGTFLLGAFLWLRAQRPGASPKARSLALGVGALGIATLASTQPGAWWSVSAISFSLIAIILLAVVLRDALKR